VADEVDTGNRRPLKSRGTAWARSAATLLTRTGISPDGISLCGVLFAAMGCWAVIAAREQPYLFLLAAAGIQLRLLCNMLDGMVAMEGGRKSSYGVLFNEMPDRIEDSILLIAFGYAAELLWLGLLAALLASLTAYVRALGGSLGFPQDFRGPMAKPHRMAALTLAAMAALGEALAGDTRYALPVALGVITVGAGLTVVRRTLGIAARLRASA
jgi:phosphatidylglycerophosphate synthase